MSRNVSWLLVSSAFAVGLGLTGVAQATTCGDLPGSSCTVTVGDNPFTVCEEDSGTVTCTGTGNEDTIVAAVHGGDPFIYGYIDCNPTCEEFCCDSADLGSITSAVPLVIDTDGSDDIICLTDASVLDCPNEIASPQNWGASGHSWHSEESPSSLLTRRDEIPPRTRPGWHQPRIPPKWRC